jgi:hypothetical protein
MKKICIFLISVTVIVLNISCSDVEDITNPEPQAGTEDHWITGAPMPTPRQEIYPAVLNQKIYIAGGLDVNRRMTNVLEIYNPDSDTWTTGPSLPQARHHRLKVV